MAHGVNANLVFGWRRQHLEAAGQCAPVARTTSSAVLLPVSINATPRATLIKVLNSSSH
jgi:transposase-like protein